MGEGGRGAGGGGRRGAVGMMVEDGGRRGQFRSAEGEEAVEFMRKRVCMLVGTKPRASSFVGLEG